MITVFEWSPSLPEHYGEYTVLIRLYDDDDKDDPRSTLYVFGVAVEQVIDDEEQIAQV